MMDAFDIQLYDYGVVLKNMTQAKLDAEYEALMSVYPKFGVFLRVVIDELQDRGIVVEQPTSMVD